MGQEGTIRASTQRKTLVSFRSPPISEKDVVLLFHENGTVSSYAPSGRLAVDGSAVSRHVYLAGLIVFLLSDSPVAIHLFNMVNRVFVQDTLGGIVVAEQPEDEGDGDGEGES